MKKRFDEDAMRWEAGELTLGELETRYPDRDVRPLAELLGRLAAISAVPTPHPGAGWAALRDQLPERLGTHERLRWRVRRPVIAVTVAALVSGTSIAYAAGVEPVRHEVSRIVKSVTSFFQGDQGTAHNGSHGNSNQGQQGNANQGNKGPNHGEQGAVGGDKGNQNGPEQGNHGEVGQSNPNEGDVRANPGNQGNPDQSEPNQSDPQPSESGNPDQSSPGNPDQSNFNQ